MKTEAAIGTVQVERLDAIPVVLKHVERMHIQEHIDSVLDPHGNWQGLSMGWLVTLWLVHILTQHTHCMVSVQEWVAAHLHTLQNLTGQPVTALDFTDDRLGISLRKLSAVDAWAEIEQRLGQHLLQVYPLEDRAVVRLDATCGSVYHNPAQHELFQLGKAKNGQFARQYKLMLGSLDPLGLPLAVDVASGERADDPLYVPCYQRVKKVLARAGVLVVGDSKMSAQRTRATIVAGGDYYLTPYPYLKHEPELLAQLQAAAADYPDQLTPVFLAVPGCEAEAEPPEEEAIAAGFEATRQQHVVLGGETITWTERLYVVQSTQYAHSICQTLQQRLEKAEQALQDLTPPPGRGKRQIREAATLRAQIQAVEAHYQVHNCFKYTYTEEVTERQVRAYRDQPARVERTVRYQLTVVRDADAIAAAAAQAGWRIYVTNAPPESLSLTQAVNVYRAQYRVENIFRRLQGKTLSITPVYVQRDDHARGLFHLLTLAARVLAVGDYLARQALARAQTELAGIYPGNPKRSTATPTTERLLAAFDNLNLLLIPLAGRYYYQVTPLSVVQCRILELWGMSGTLYTGLATA